MELPSVKHPKRVAINGFIFEVVAYCSLTDEQALKIAMGYCHTHRLAKSRKGKVTKILTQFDQDSLATL